MVILLSEECNLKSELFGYCILRSSFNSHDLQCLTNQNFALLKKQNDNISHSVYMYNLTTCAKENVVPFNLFSSKFEIKKVKKSCQDR